MVVCAGAIGATSAEEMPVEAGVRVRGKDRASLGNVLVVEILGRE